MKKYNIAVVGATGVVGSTFLKVLAEYKMPINELFLFASSKSAGKVINYEGKDVVVRELTKDSFKGLGIEIALFTDAMKRYAERRDRDSIKLHKYAKLFNIEDEIRKYLEVLL